MEGGPWTGLATRKASVVSTDEGRLKWLMGTGWADGWVKRGDKNEIVLLMFLCV